MAKDSLGIVQVRDEPELHALQDADPAIQPGRGFRYESLLILQIVR